MFVYNTHKGLKPIVLGIIVDASLTDTALIAESNYRPSSFAEAENDYHCGWEPDLAGESESDHAQVVFGVKDEEKDPV